MKMKLVLTGVRSNFSGMLGRKVFANGVSEIVGTVAELEMCARYMRSYEAYPEGSAELKAKKDQDDGVQRKPSPDGERGNTEGLSGNQPGPAGEVPGANSLLGDGHDPLEPALGTEGLGAGGSGPGHTGLHADEVAKIRKALSSLDPKIAEQWTDEGLPSVEVIAALVSDPSITRKMIDAVAPEFTREKVAEATDL